MLENPIYWYGFASGTLSLVGAIWLLLLPKAFSLFAAGGRYVWQLAHQKSGN